MSCTTTRLAVVDEHRPGAVDDLAARRLDAHVARAVLARLDEVLVAAEHLEEPEAEEDDREQRERDPAEDGDAQRELRGDRRAPVLDALHGWMSGREAGGRTAAAAPRRLRQGGREDAAHERVDGQREQRVDEDGREDLAEQLEADRRLDAEQELHDREDDERHRGAGRAGGERQQRRLAGRATVSRRRPAKWPTITSTSDETPSVWSSAKSTNRPIEKPMSAPGDRARRAGPPRSTTSGAMSGVAPNSAICETAAICTSTATHGEERRGGARAGRCRCSRRRAP